MGHPAVENHTGFAFDPAFLVDEEERPVFVPIVKATFTIDAAGALKRAIKQEPVNSAGSFHGPPDVSSYKFEPESAFTKPSTDCVLLGHAHAPHAGATTVDVAFRIGTLGKAVRVVGDRKWYRVMGTPRMTAPTPFERIPLTYERAFGGWDRVDSDPRRHAFEARNPVGRGFRVRWHPVEEFVSLPNLEDPAHLISSFADRPPPASFGFLSPHWAPRAALGGTFDAAWMAGRMPRLPRDFDRRYFNAASPGLIAPSYLRGDEQVSVAGASPRGPVSFNLPGEPPPTVEVELRGGRKQTVQTKLDTVIVDMDVHAVTLLWRAHVPVRQVPHDVVAVVAKSGANANVAAG